MRQANPEPDRAAPAGRSNRQGGVAMRHRCASIVALAAAIVVAAPLVTTAAQPATPAASPAACLTLQTFSVAAGDHPHDVAPAADGRVWYTAQAAGALGLLDPKTGAVERVPLGAGSAPHGVIVGPDGAAWVTDGGLNAIVRVDAATHAVKTFPLPAAAGAANLNTAVFDQDGVLWFTGQSGIVGRLDPATGAIRVWPAPRGAGPYGITVTPGGEVYFASLAGSYLGRIEPAGADIRIEAIDPPTAGAGPRRVWSDANGALWISEWNAGQLARYEPATGQWREWRLPGDAPHAYAVYVDAAGAVWLSDFGDNALLRFDPATESFASVPLPDPNAAVRQLNGRAGAVWGAESGADKLVAVRVNC
jgi:virginiamycin B lyase